VRLRTLLRNQIHAVLAGHGHDRPAGCWSGPGRTWLASLELPAVSREVIEDDLALIGALEDRIGRLDWEIHQHARSGPRVKVLTQLPGTGPFTALVILAEVGDVSRFGSARKLASWAGLTPDRPRLRPRRPPRSHLQTGLGVAALGIVRGGADGQAFPAVRRQLPGHRQTPGEEDRHHRDRPQAAHPRLAPAHRRRRRSAATRHSIRPPNGDGVTGPEGAARPRASPENTLSRPRPRSKI
jgi:transposase